MFAKGGGMRRLLSTRLNSRFVCLGVYFRSFSDVVSFLLSVITVDPCCFQHACDLEAEHSFPSRPISINTGLKNRFSFLGQPSWDKCSEHWFSSELSNHCYNDVPHKTVSLQGRAQIHVFLSSSMMSHTGLTIYESEHKYKCSSCLQFRSIKLFIEADFLHIFSTKYYDLSLCHITKQNTVVPKQI